MSAARRLAAILAADVAGYSRRWLAAQPDYRPGLLVKVASSAQLGRVDEACDALSRVLQLEPGLTIARWKTTASPLSPERLARCVEGFRKAGMPEE